MLTKAGLERVSCQAAGTLKLGDETVSRKRKRQAAPLPGSNDATATVELDFAAMRAEVQQFGASHLDNKKDKRTFEQRTLERLGLQTERGPRIGALVLARGLYGLACGVSCLASRACGVAGAKIGQGMAKKATLRAALAEEELINAGMLQVKGRARRKAAGKRATGDRGLNEAKGFVPGLLKVAKPKGKGQKPTAGLPRGGGRGRRRG